MNERNSFIRGAGRVLDLGARNKDALSITSHIINDDRTAIAKDWENVGKSIQKSIRIYNGREFRR